MNTDQEVRIRGGDVSRGDVVQHQPVGRPDVGSGEEDAAVSIAINGIVNDFGESGTRRIATDQNSRTSVRIHQVVEHEDPVRILDVDSPALVARDDVIGNRCLVGSTLHVYARACPINHEATDFDSDLAVEEKAVREARRSDHHVARRFANLDSTAVGNETHSPPSRGLDVPLIVAPRTNNDAIPGPRQGCSSGDGPESSRRRVADVGVVARCAHVNRRPFRPLDGGPDSAAKH